MPTAADDRILSCGHKPSPHSEHTTGTAQTPDGREICWDCAYEEEKWDMATSDKYVAYLDTDKGIVTNWVGKELGKVSGLVKREHNMAGHMYYFSVRAWDGSRWYGRGTGSHMYCRLTRCKARVNPCETDC